MEQYKTCQGINKKTGKLCKRLAKKGSIYCLAHDTTIESIQTRTHVARMGGKKPRILISKLRGFVGKNSADYAEALKTILNQMLVKGLLKTTKDVSVFNSLLGSYVKLEQSALIPMKMIEVEKLLAKRESNILDEDLIKQ